MSLPELAKIRQEILNGNLQFLKRVYSDYRSDCIRILMSKNYCDSDTAHDLFTDSIIVLRENLLNRKVQNLNNIKSYLTGICINLAKEKKKKHINKNKKMDLVRLLYYENGHNTIEAKEEQEELVKICKSALIKLSERCQKILVAFYVHKMSMQEIAEDLEMSSRDVAKTIKSRCYKQWIKETKLIHQTK
jgi:RNA polymerase sigma factor (sigma-70 family)